MCQLATKQTKTKRHNYIWQVSLSVVDFKFFEKFRYFCGEKLFCEFTEIISKFSKMNVFHGEQRKFIMICSRMIRIFVCCGRCRWEDKLNRRCENFSGQLFHKIDPLTTSVCCGLY